MATTRHVTLTANQVTTVTVPKDYDTVAVFHRGNVAEDLWATVNDVDPVAEGNDNYCIPSGARRTILRHAQVGDSDVRLRSAGAVKVEVEFA